MLYTDIHTRYVSFDSMLFDKSPSSFGARSSLSADYRLLDECFERSTALLIGESHLPEVPAR